MTQQYEQPDWYDQEKLVKAYYAKAYTGWVIDLGDGTCRFANTPLLGKDGPKYGDRVRLIPAKEKGDFPSVDASKILEEG